MGRRRRSSAGSKLLRTLIILLIAGAVVTLRFSGTLGPNQPVEASRFVVDRVIDGDTVELSGGDKVRLLSIDTPELGQPFHDEARDYLSRLIMGKSIRLEYGKDRRDKYGRLLAYLYVDTMFVNRELLYNGYGNLYLFRNDELGRSETKLLLAAQRSALDRHTGVWSKPRTREAKYYARAHSFRFHRPNCRTLDDNPANLREIATREAALYEGLSPCRTCEP